MGRLVRAAALCLLIAGTASADDQVDFEKGANAFKNKDYVEAESRFRTMVNPKTALQSPTLLDHAHAYLGATIIELGKSRDEALLEFKAVLLHNPDYKPENLMVFPTPVLDAFVDAKALFKKEILAEKERREREERERREREEKEKEKQRLYLAALEKQAGEQIETQKRSRLLTFVPFGAGQFQNGQAALGWTFLLGETALLAGGAIAGGLAIYNLDQYNFWLRNAQPNQNYFVNEYRTRFNTAAVANYVFDGAFVVAAIAGIIQANFAFVPQTTITKPRPLPKVTFQMGAGTVGIEGSF